jgi:hypothetical protein
MYPLRTFVKDPSAVLDYSFDWTADGWIGADTITGTPVWTVPTGVTKDSQSNTTTMATVVISGGTAGENYDVACKITTAGGRTDERTFRLQVRDR